MAPVKLACRLAFAATAALLWALPADAANLFDPSLAWKTIVTPHFRVNYAAENEEVARLAAGYAEEAHQILSPWLEEVPENRTEMTIVDHEDMVQGYSFPLPNNQIWLYLTSPASDQLMSRHDSWLRDLVIHEYTHLLHMEKTAGLAALVNKVVGRSYYPNLFLPIFLIEGLAVHTETRWSSGGRGRDTAYQMYLRVAALEDQLAGIDKASGYFTIDHPGGEIPYIYGMAFYRHLATHYGADAPARLAKDHAANPYVGVWGLDDELKAITGRTAVQLWADMRAELKADARRQREAAIARGPLTPVTLVTTSGMHHRHPRFLPKGDLAWGEWTGHGYAHLVSSEPHKKDAKPRRIITKSPFGSWDVSRDGRWLYHSRSWDDNRFTGFEDAFRWDLKNRKIERLSTRARLDMPAVSPDGRWVVAVQNGRGQTNLVKMRADGSKAAPLTTLTDRSQLSSPAWHPRRDAIAVSAWRAGGRDLYLVHPERGTLTPLWRDRHVDQDPAWTPDGRHLVFTSDRDGVYNLYAYELATKKLFRITNVVGGLIEPAVSPDGKTLACASFGVKGWDIATLPWEPKAWRQVPTPVDEPGMAQPEPAVSAAAFPAQVYDPLPSLRPKTWAPFGFMDERGPVWGFQTFGQDVLMRHYVFGAFGLGLASGRPFYSLGYSNEVLYPSFYAYAMDTPLISAPTMDGVPFWVVQRARYQGLSMTLPGLPSIFLQTQSATGDNLSLAFNAQHVQDENDVADHNLPERVRPRTGQTNTLAATYKYSDNYKFAYSISPEGGTLATLGYEKALPAIGSRYDFDRVWVDVRRYAGLPWQHHALAVRLSGGTNVGREAGDFYLGGAESSTLFSNIDLRTASSVGTRFMPLRGYGFAAQSGASALAVSSEWRFPVYDVQRGLGVYPIFVRNLHGAVFAEAGQAWDGWFDWRRSLADVGVELRAQAHVQQAPTEIRAGIGQGLVATGRGAQWPIVFFELGTYF